MENNNITNYIKIIYLGKNIHNQGIGKSTLLFTNDLKSDQINNKINIFV